MNIMILQKTLAKRLNKFYALLNISAKNEGRVQMNTKTSKFRFLAI